MKLHILSDLHFEFGKWPKGIDVNVVDADVTVLAGDIGIGLAGIQWALTIDRPVIYVMGNHEFYGQRPMTELWRKAREKVSGTHVHLLENESVLVDGVRFLGATLWTDFCVLGPELQEQCMEDAASAMTDYSAIYVSRRGHALTDAGMVVGRQGDRLTPHRTLVWHHESRDFLERELSRATTEWELTDSWRKTVVVTHHAPSARSLLNQKASASGTAAYASHLDALVAKADLWVHGHIHRFVDYDIEPGRGRVVSNPRGYAGHELVREFDPGFVVEV